MPHSLPPTPALAQFLTYVAPTATDLPAGQATLYSPTSVPLPPNFPLLQLLRCIAPGPWVRYHGHHEPLSAAWTIGATLSAQCGQLPIGADAAVDQPMRGEDPGRSSQSGGEAGGAGASAEWL